MLRASFLLACFAGSALAAPRPQVPVVTNTGLARPVTIANVPPPGPGLAFRVSEAAQGASDLNGDGDTLDHVLAIAPQSAGSVLVVGLASDEYGPAQVGGTVAMGVRESAQGGQDLNGDGDANDIVLHLIDAGSGAVTNTGLAYFGERMALSASHVAVAVFEVAQGGTDLNGDGDTTDFVLHHVRLSDGVQSNVGLEVSTLTIDGGVVSGYAFEGFYGDLNGDGDASDNIPYLFDAVQGNALLLTASAQSPIRVHASFAVYGLLESAVGADLNGDGDQTDLVAQIHDLAGATVTNTGRGLHNQLFSTEGPFMAFDVPEAMQQQDLNGDGDQTDFVAHYVQLPTAAVSNTGLAGSIFRGQGRLLLVRVQEAFQGGQDLNGDGDATDTSVLHVVRLGNGNVTNLGLQANAISSGGRLIGFEVNEAGQGTDLSGDGDLFDRVLHVYDSVLGTTTNLGFDGTFPLLYGSGDDFVLCGFHEGVSGAPDLNGDGDVDDTVLHLLQPGQAPQNLGLDVFIPASLLGRRVVFAVRENKQANSSLNGDADTADQVVHLLDVP